MSNIYYLLDESGSMFERKEMVINGMKEFLDDQRRLSDNCKISIYTFNDEIKVLFENIEITNIKNFPIESYNPHSSTSLLDAMGYVLEKIPENDNGLKYIVIILTDGEENSSKYYKKNQIRTLLEKRPHVNVTYIGSNQDIILNGITMGATIDSSLEYNDNFLVSAMRCTSDAIKRFQTDETPTIVYTELERQQSVGKNTIFKF